MKNNLYKLSEEELLKALETAIESSAISEESEIMRFIHTFDLKAGNHKITSKALYELYSKSSIEPMTRKKFIEQFTKIFKLHQGTYDLNIDPIKIGNLITKAVPRRDKTESPYYKTHFENFIKNYDIKRGTFKMKGVILYDLYDKWHYETLKRKYNTLSYQLFVQFMELFTNFKQDHYNIYFSVNPNILDHLTDEQKLQCLSPKGQKHAIKKENKKKSN